MLSFTNAMKSHRLALLSLGLGTLLFALGPSVLKLLTTMGGRLGLMNPGAISFCNVLFVGNFCAGLVTLAFYGIRPLFGELIRIPRRTQAALVLAAVLSTIYPALLFTALEQTSVINVILLSRFNGVVFVALSYIFLKTTISKAELIGYGVMAMGVLLLVFINNGGLKIQTGELLILVATIFYALTEFVSKIVLRHCSSPTYVFFRNMVSAVLFFISAVYLYGFEHFADAFSGELWILMFLYAGIAVVAAQLFWLNATQFLPVTTVVNGQLLNPGFSIAFAYLLLNEAPGPLEWIVMGIILTGIMIPRLRHSRHEQMEMQTFHFEMGLVGK